MVNGNNTQNAIQPKRENKERDHRNLMISLMALFTIILFIFSLGVGQFEIPLSDTIKILLSPLFDFEQTWDPMMEKVILQIRLPRLIACVLVGGGLALSGAVFQGLFKNPLVSQDILGVSGGAGVGAAIAIALGFTGFGIQAFAFIGGILAVLMVVGIASLIRNKSTLILVLAGIIVGGFTSSFLTLIKYVVDPEVTLANITYWLMGSLANVIFPDVKMIYIPMVICIIVLLAMRWQINILTLGDNEAKILGKNVRGLRGIFIVCSTILTASAVCISGTIGWFGLVVPHIARLIVGENHQKMIPMSLFTGMVIMMLVDNTARTLTSTEIPLSVITGILGAPVFTYLLLRKRGKQL